MLLAACLFNNSLILFIILTFEMYWLFKRVIYYNISSPSLPSYLTPFSAKNPLSIGARSLNLEPYQLTEGFSFVSLVPSGDTSIAFHSWTIS